MGTVDGFHLCSTLPRVPLKYLTPQSPPSSVGAPRVHPRRPAPRRATQTRATTRPPLARRRRSKVPSETEPSARARRRRRAHAPGAGALRARSRRFASYGVRLKRSFRADDGPEATRLRERVASGVASEARARVDSAARRGVGRDGASKRVGGGGGSPRGGDREARCRGGSRRGRARALLAARWRAGQAPRPPRGGRPGDDGLRQGAAQELRTQGCARALFPSPSRARDARAASNDERGRYPRLARDDDVGSEGRQCEFRESNSIAGGPAGSSRLVSDPRALSLSTRSPPAFPTSQ